MVIRISESVKNQSLMKQAIMNAYTAIFLSTTSLILTMVLLAGIARQIIYRKATRNAITTWTGNRRRIPSTTES